MSDLIYLKNHVFKQKILHMQAHYLNIYLSLFQHFSTQLPLLFSDQNFLCTVLVFVEI